MWAPELDASDDLPLYRQLSDAIGRAVGRGDLGEGAFLPTHRALARRLGIAVTTVSRAYRDAQHHGWVVGEVGRGTRVRGPLTEPVGASTAERSGPIDLRRNSLLPHPHLSDLQQDMARVLAAGGTRPFLGYGPCGGHLHHRESASAWLTQEAGLDAEAERIVVTAGVQHGMAVVLSTLAGPGEPVLVEDVTYAGLMSVAEHLGLDPVPIAMDEEGVLPDALASALKRHPGAPLYCMPSLQNPTAAVMSVARRERIAEIANTAGTAVVEDDSYGFLLGPRTVLAGLCDRGFHLTGTSKSLLPGLRVGFIHAPADAIPALEAALVGTVYQASPLMTEVVSEWIRSGRTAQIMEWKREELEARQEVARAHLPHARMRTHVRSPHLWLELPQEIRSGELVTDAALRGVRIMDAAPHAVASTPNAVRVCLGPPPTRALLAGALDTLSELLDPRARADVVV